MGQAAQNHRTRFGIQRIASRWKNADTLLIATDFGDGTLTSSGHPRLVKEWSRGTSLHEARQVFEASVNDILAVRLALRTSLGQYEFVVRLKTVFTSELCLVLANRLVRLKGGHGTGAINRQRAQITALEYAFLWDALRPLDRFVRNYTATGGVEQQKEVK